MQLEGRTKSSFSWPLSEISSPIIWVEINFYNLSFRCQMQLFFSLLTWNSGLAPPDSQPPFLTYTTEDKICIYYKLGNYVSYPNKIFKSWLLMGLNHTWYGLTFCSRITIFIEFQRCQCCGEARLLGVAQAGAVSLVEPIPEMCAPLSTPALFLCSVHYLCVSNIKQDFWFWNSTVISTGSHSFPFTAENS